MSVITIRTGDTQITIEAALKKLEAFANVEVAEIVHHRENWVSRSTTPPTGRFSKVRSDGVLIINEDARTDHVAVIDNSTGLMWSVESLGDPDDADDGISQEACAKRCAELRLLGLDDWRLPTRAELAGLIDDTHHEPAIDTEFFPRVKPRWHWTSTAAAWSSASAWLVGFGLGGVGGSLRHYDGFALAVRRAGQ